MIYIGCDPGKSGATAFLGEWGNDVKFIKHSETPHDVAASIRDAWIAHKGEVFAYIEKVHSMPGQGVASSFKFGQSYGFLLGILTAVKIPYETVTPQKWQKAMGCLTKGDKNISKAKAQELFPETKMTHAIADAILIAEFCRRSRQK